MPRYLPVGVSSGGAADVHLRRVRGRQVGLADPREGVRDGRVRPQDDRLGGHQTARRVLLVRHQAAHVGRVRGPHQAQQPLLVRLRQLAQQVGRVVGVHRLQHIRGPLLRQHAQDLDLVVLGQLLQHVREPVVVQGGGHLRPPLGGQVVQHVGQVGGAELLEGGEQVLRALPGLLQREAGDGGPLHGQRLALAAPERAALLPLAHEDPVDLPLAARRELMHRQVQDGDLLAGVHQRHPPVEQLAEHQPLGGPLLEAADVEHPGGDDLAGLHGGHPGHGQEDAAPGGELDHQAEQPGRTTAGAQDDDEIAHAADLVARRVEDGDTGDVRDEEPWCPRCHSGGSFACVRSASLPCTAWCVCFPDCPLGRASG
ncbi:hypothetical protein RKD47_002098 [Streptomyces albogriseolus]